MTDPSKIDYNDWARFVDHHPNRNIFQSPQMFEFFKGVKNYEPYIFAAIEKENEIGGILSSILMKEAGIAGFFSSRCIVWGGPLVQDNDPEVAVQLLNALDKKTKKRAIYTEFRNLFDTKEFLLYFEKLGFIYKPYLNYLIPLHKGKDYIFNNIKAEKRRQIRKSLKTGTEIIQANSITEIKEFYTVLKNIYLVKVKKPLPEIDFFEKLFENNLAVFLLVHYDSKIIGGTCLLKYNNKTVYDWYRGGMDVQYKKLYPSTVAVWAGLEYASDNNYELYDFMGAGSPEKDYGVRNFKSQFGGNLVNYGRYIKINKPVLFWIGKVGVRVLGWIRKVMR